MLCLTGMVYSDRGAEQFDLRLINPSGHQDDLPSVQEQLPLFRGLGSSLDQFGLQDALPHWHCLQGEGAGQFDLRLINP